MMTFDDEGDEYKSGWNSGTTLYYRHSLCTYF